MKDNSDRVFLALTTSGMLVRKRPRHNPDRGSKPFTFPPSSRIFLRMKLCLMLLLALTLPAFAGEPRLKLFPVDNNILYLRAAEVADNFSTEFRTAGFTNQFSGLVVDLRQAGGASQAGIADFLTAKKIPLVVLTDAQTQGAATALAAQLHTAGAVIIACGTNITATNPADLRVTLATEAEKKFLENPFTNAPAVEAIKLAGATNLMFYVDHTSEAELVRKRVKDGEEEDSNSPRTAPAQPVINDPALARAVDLLKALAALHRARG